MDNPGLKYSLEFPPTLTASTKELLSAAGHLLAHFVEVTIKVTKVIRIKLW